MPEAPEWRKVPVRALLAVEFAGAWGDDPGSQGTNAFILRSTNIDDDGHIDLASAAPRRLDSKDLSRKRLRPGDILLEASGGGPGKAVGRVARFAGDHARTYVCSNFFRTLRPNSQVDASFLTWSLQRIYNSPSIWSYQQQTTGIINLKHADYLRQPIPVPPLEQQRRIAEILDTADESIRSTERLIAKLATVRTGVVSEAFSPAHRDWPTTMLGQVASIGSGATPPRGVSLFWKNGTIPWVRTGEVTFRPILTTGELITASAVTAANLRIYPPNTVILAMYGQGTTRGRVGFLNIPATVNQACAAIIPNKSILIPKFLYYFLESQYKNLRSLSQGSHQDNLNSKLLAELLVPAPPINEQHRAAQIIDAASLSLEAQNSELAKLRTVKQGLMEDLLTGRVRVHA